MLTVAGDKVGDETSEFVHDECATADLVEVDRYHLDISGPAGIQWINITLS